MAAVVKEIYVSGAGGAPMERVLEVEAIAGKRLSVGAVVLDFDRPRPSCRYMETLTQTGMMAALSGWRGGICARVVNGGVIR